MSKKEKVFSVMSREDSKNFANDYFVNKIKNNYQLIPGFNLDPVIENKTVVEENQNSENNSIFTPIEEKNVQNSIVNNEITNIDTSLSNKENTNNYYYNENINFNQVNQDQNTQNTSENVVTQDKNQSLIGQNQSNDLIFNNLSSSYNYNNENGYSHNTEDNNHQNNFNSFTDYYEENYEGIENNNIKEHSNGLSSWSMKKNKDYEFKNDSFEIEESENLQSLLNDYNMKKNILIDDSFDDDTYFSYLSKKKIKTIISEKLGYCNEEMLDEIHSKAINENWKELDVQKWLLNPENINRFKEMDFEKNIDHPINFSSSEIDNSLFNLSDKSLNDDSYINQSISNKNQIETNEVQNKHNDLQVNDYHNLVKNNHHDYIENHHNHGDICECKKNKLSLCECKKDFYNTCHKNAVDEIKSNQKLFEKEMSNKFDILNTQIQNMNGNFKATLVDESYRKLLLDNQTETIKNYFNEKMLTSQFSSITFPKIRQINPSLNTDNLNSQKSFYFNKRKKRNWKNPKNNDSFLTNNENKKLDKTLHDQEILNSKISELNKKVDYEINEINSNLSKWEKSSINELNELKSIISEISNKLDSANQANQREIISEKEDFVFDEKFENSSSFAKDFELESFYLSTEENLLTEILESNEKELKINILVN